MAALFTVFKIGGVIGILPIVLGPHLGTSPVERIVLMMWELINEKLIAMLALATSFNTIATTQTTVDLSKLTPEQRAQITQQVKELSSEPTNVSVASLGVE